MLAPHLDSVGIYQHQDKLGVLRAAGDVRGKPGHPCRATMAEVLVATWTQMMARALDGLGTA